MFVKLIKPNEVITKTFLNTHKIQTNVHEILNTLTIQTCEIIFCQNEPANTFKKINKSNFPEKEFSYYKSCQFLPYMNHK